MSKIFKAIEEGDIEQIREIILNGCDLNNTFDIEDEGKTPLMAAVELNNKEVIDILLKSGSNIFQTTELRGDNVITWCSKWGISENFNLLAQYMGENFNINYANEEGNTALMLAANYGFNDMLNTILEYEPALDIKNSDQEDVFDILNSQLINGRESTKEILSKFLTKKTIMKIKKI